MALFAHGGEERKGLYNSSGKAKPLTSHFTFNVVASRPWHLTDKNNILVRHLSISVERLLLRKRYLRNMAEEAGVQMAAVPLHLAGRRR